MKAIGPYQLLDELGRGAMGVVYRGFDPVIGRPVAIKLIQTDRFASALDKAQNKLRFAREAAAAGRLSHPNIVTVYQLGEDDGLQYLVQELVIGQSLEQILTECRRPEWKSIVSIISQIAGALDYAHAEGIVHRDVKPANILIRSDGTVKITDFGIARIASQTVTKTGLTFGTPAYMSPEQIISARVDGKADQFSLGVVVYEMVTGRRPFDADSGPALMHQITSMEPPSAHQVNPMICLETAKLISKALAKRPEDRFLSCKDFTDCVAESLKIALVKKEDSRATVTMPGAAADKPRRLRVALWVATGLTCVALGGIGWMNWPGPIRLTQGMSSEKSNPNLPHAADRRASSSYSDRKPDLSGVIPGTSGTITPQAAEKRPVQPPTATPAPEDKSRKANAPGSHPSSTSREPATNTLAAASSASPKKEVGKANASGNGPQAGLSSGDDERLANLRRSEGLQLEHQRKFSEAFSAFSEAVKLKPDFAEAYFDRCRIYGVLSSVVRTPGALPLTGELRGLDFMALDEHATDDCSRAIELRPDFSDAYLFRGLSYLVSGQYDRSIRDSTEAINLMAKDTVKSPYSVAGAYSNRAGAYAHEKMPDLAIQDYTTAINAQPSWNNYYGRAEQYRLKGDYQLAINDYDEAIRLYPKYPLSYEGRAAAKKSIGDEAGATADLQSAGELRKK